MSRFADNAEAITWLRTPEAIRARCEAVFEAAAAGRSSHFEIDGDRLQKAADYVADTIRRDYPELRIPYHSRWRHFTAAGIDRWGALATSLAGTGREEIARKRFDLAVISVLLDAGAGEAWRFREDGTFHVLARSEGLAVASFHLFVSGVLSDDPEDGLRTDAGALERLDGATLGAAFQAGADNPLVGLDGRAALLRRLGQALRAAPDLFGAEHPRVGNLFDHLAAGAGDGGLPARDILIAILRGLGSVWPGRIALDGTSLGDVWRHPAAHGDGPTEGLVPFHKLSQWLAYSLVEPLEEAGLTVTGLDALTGLAEYRNGGLFVDFGVIRARDAALLETPQPVGGEAVVEWRALTVALLDRIAAPVRAGLGVDEGALPLARILEGGTWSAGRRIARERRADGSPPIRVVSDGTVM